MSRLRIFLTSIRFRMLALYLIVIFVAFATIMLISVNLIESSLMNNTIVTTLNELNRISYSLTQSVERKDLDTVHDTIMSYAQSSGGRVLVLNTDYMVVDDSSSLFNGYYLPYDEAVVVLNGASESSYGFHKLKNPKSGIQEWIAYFAKPLSANGLNTGVLMIAVSIQKSSNIIDSVQKNLWAAFAVVISAMTIIWVFLASRVVRPVAELTGVMRNATAKTFENRVDIKATGEVAELVDAFNRMGSELNAHDKIRDRFVADASHELKTPLAAIKALAESIIYNDNPPPEVMLDFMKDINEQVDRLNNIVQDLLQVARDSSMDVKYKMETLNFSKIASGISHLITPVAEKKGLKLIMHIDDGIEIFGDKSRMERVVTNLIDNAVKYTEHGHIEVRLRRDRREAVFSVKDTGIGIPEESIPRLFIRFYRVDKARSRATGGTGLGLSMVEEIVNRHSGTIKVESKQGEGSEFTVRIPLAN